MKTKTNITDKINIFYNDTPQELINYYDKINKKRICTFCNKHEVPSNAMASICKDCWEKFCRSDYNKILKKKDINKKEKKKKGRNSYKEM